MPKKLLLLVNPYSGSGKSLAACEYLKKKLTDYTFNTIVSQYKGHFADFLSKEDLNQYEKIIIFGGDGTMHEVTNGIAEKGATPPMLLFPCGGGKALNHDINNLDWESSLQKFKVNNTKLIDIFKLRFADTTDAQPLYGFNVIGWGLVSYINATAEKLRWVGGLRYSLAAIIHIFKNPSFEAKVVVDDEVFTGNFCFVLACNTQHTGKAMKIAPLAVLDDGLLDVLVIKHVPFYHLLRLFPLIFSGKHIHSPLVIYKKARKFSIDAEPLSLVLDGEVKGQTPLQAEVLPNKLNMIV
ncbi:diacylglycerol/lipid kinase family protein [Emticicia soli]|uniref:Diacylglycerol/lipid kinase family protein n=1 Tax=Emticicia soli TaxID=2027878 RepID=A0ABW5J1E7_9BACT